MGSGTGDKARGKLDEARGKVKETVGRTTKDRSLEAEYIALRVSRRL